MNFQIIFNKIFNRFLIPAVIDPQVVKYVTTVMNEKNEQLGKPVFGVVMIAKMPEKFLTFPNAFTVKNHTQFPYLLFSSTTLDILEHLIFDETAQTYTLTNIAPLSAYTMKTVLSKRRAERMICAIVEHELGHIYYTHHCRHYAPYLLMKMAGWLAVAWYGVYKKFVAFTGLPVIMDIPVDWPLILVWVSVWKITSIFMQFFNSTFTSSSNGEQEADEFIANDYEILKGAILFQEIALQAQSYIYSYSNKWIRFYSWWYGLDCADFVKKNPKKAHDCIENAALLSSMYHPLHQERRARFEERIKQLPIEEHKEIESVVITIYKATQIIERFEV